MRFKNFTQKTYWFLGILIVVSVAMIVKGCNIEHNSPSNPSGGQQKEVVFKLTQDSRFQGKATRHSLVARRLLDDLTVGPIIDDNPNFPTSIQLMLPILPPTLCEYLITSTADLTRDPPVSQSRVIDACNDFLLEFTLNTFEAPLVEGDPFESLPSSFNAGEAPEICCGGTAPTFLIDAPDIDRKPLFAILSELNSSVEVRGEIDTNTSVCGIFPDPNPPELRIPRRVFICRITDDPNAPRAKPDPFSIPVDLTTEVNVKYPSESGPSGPSQVPDSITVGIQPHNLQIYAISKTQSLQTSATVRDAASNPVSGVRVECNITGCGNVVTFSPDDVTKSTDSSGLIEFSSQVKPINFGNCTFTVSCTTRGDVKRSDSASGTVSVMSSSAGKFLLKEFQPVSLTTSDITLSPLPQTVKNIQDSGIDAVLSYIDDVLTIDFSEPVLFASLNTSGNTGDIILEASDQSSNPIDMDVGLSTFSVSGKDIVKLVLRGVDGKLDELSFIPQL